MGNLGHSLFQTEITFGPVDLDDYTIPPVPQSSLDRFQKLKLEQKNKMKKNENSEEDDYELLEFYPSWAL